MKGNNNIVQRLKKFFILEWKMKEQTPITDHIKLLSYPLNNGHLQ